MTTGKVPSQNFMKMRKIIIGVTGTLASGKTTVSKMLEDLGAFRIDADKIGHDLLRSDKEIKKEILDVFGEDVFERGELSRKRLREKVFDNGADLKMLNRIMHPAIIRKIKDQIRESEKSKIVIDAPLLFETGLDKMTDLDITVACDREKCISRAEKKGWDALTAEKMISEQLPGSEKIKRADLVICNDSDLKRTKKQVEELWSRKLPSRQEEKKS